MLNHYEILQVNPNAPTEVIRGAYTALAKKYHPDKNPGNPAAAFSMKAVNAAYEVLRDPTRRSEYDALLHQMASNLRAVRLEDEESLYRAAQAQALRSMHEAVQQRRKQEEDIWRSERANARYKFRFRIGSAIVLGGSILGLWFTEHQFWALCVLAFAVYVVIPIVSE